MEFLVGAPPEAVFAVVADLPNWPHFISAIESVALLTPGPVGVGTRFRETRTMFGRQATEEMTVAEFVPPSRLVLTAFNHGTAYRIEHRLVAEKTGTRMTLALEGRPTTLLARLFAPLGWLFAGSVKPQLQADGADLKRESERRHRSGGSPAPSNNRSDAALEAGPATRRRERLDDVRSRCLRCYHRGVQTGGGDARWPASTAARAAAD